MIRNTFHMIPELGPRNSPAFVFAHVLIPHPPFVFGPNGEPVNREKNPTQNELLRLKDRASYRRGYRNQMAYTNKLLIRTIDGIGARSEKPAIIILEGDHGPSLNSTGTVNKRFIREKFGILNAYYLPFGVKNRHYEDVTPVNSFRIIFNRYFGTNFKLLEDRSYYAPFHFPYRLTDVTRRTRGD